MKTQRPFVVWFGNPHEQSVHYLKFGLMALARQGEIDLEERPTATAKGWLAADLRQRQYRRIALLGLKWHNKRRLVAVDGEDSPFQLSDLLERVDRYYTCTYCPHLFEERQFRFALTWQTKEEIQPYQQLFERVVNRYGEQLSKVRPWAPIGPNLEFPRPRHSWPQQKLANLRHKLQLRLQGTVDWMPQFERFSSRWESIKNMRTLTPSLDVALMDSLWGWPRHRIALHHQLALLSTQGYAIHSRLGYRMPELYELGDSPAPDPAIFPMQVGQGLGSNYEQMLADSRLGVFATGFHYGWRNIVSLAWALGLKTLQDPFSYRFLFDPTPFWQPLGPRIWDDLASRLERARLEPSVERHARWELFDQVACPQRMAALVVSQLCSELF